MDADGTSGFLLLPVGSGDGPVDERHEQRSFSGGLFWDFAVGDGTNGFLLLPVGIGAE